VAAAVLTACRTATTGAAVRSAVDTALGRATSSTEVQHALSDLQAKHLILQDRGRYLSLVLETVRPLPTHAESAGGEIRTVDFAERFVDRSLARECRRLPQEVPVQELFSVT
jgi:hypothetical protein